MNAPRVTLAKTGTRWGCTVRLPCGAQAYTVRDTWQQAYDARHELHAELTEQLQPIRGEAADGPRGRTGEAA